MVMILEQMAALAKSAESETLEFMAATATSRKAVETVHATFNQRGGHVQFAATSDGRIAGQQVSERSVEQEGSEI